MPQPIQNRRFEDAIPEFSTFGLGFNPRLHSRSRLRHPRAKTYIFLTNDLFKNLQLAFAGLALLLIVLFVPAGLVGWIRGRFPVTRRWLE